MALLSPVLPHFDLEGNLVDADQILRGHINKTYVATVDQDGVSTRYVHQWINKNIFTDPPQLMENIRRVVEHVNKKRGNDGSSLTLIPGDHGLSYYLDPTGEYWRTYLFVEESVVYDIVTSPDVAYEAALTFGKFLNDLSDLDATTLHETIPGFHDTPRRLQAFEKAVESASPERREEAAEQIQFVRSMSWLAPKLTDVVKSRPEALRVTHNDTKVNNVLFHERTGKGLCVIDLDTVMPGTVLCDIGDLIRTATNTGAEDAQDLSDVNFDVDLHRGVVTGFTEALGDSLCQEEKEALPFCGEVLTYECGTRFLTDFLNGDTYFQTKYPGHNLVRAKAQFHLLERMREQHEAVERVCADALGSTGR